MLFYKNKNKQHDFLKSNKPQNTKLTNVEIQPQVEANQGPETIIQMGLTDWLAGSWVPSRPYFDDCPSCPGTIR